MKIGYLVIRDSHLLLPVPLKQLQRNFLGNMEDIPYNNVIVLQQVFSTWEYSQKSLNILLKTYLDILKRFQQQVFEDLQQDIVKNISLSYLAYKIYRSQYMEIDSIGSFFKYCFFLHGSFSRRFCGSFQTERLRPCVSLVVPPRAIIMISFHPTRQLWRRKSFRMVDPGMLRILMWILKLFMDFLR
jgi:hypothetical protein